MERGLRTNNAHIKAGTSCSTLSWSVPAATTTPRLGGRDQGAADQVSGEASLACHDIPPWPLLGTCRERKHTRAL